MKKLLKFLVFTFFFLVLVIVAAFFVVRQGVIPFEKIEAIANGIYKVVEKEVLNDGDDGTSFKDLRDGKKYKIVRIGKQVWMAENIGYKVKGSVCFSEDKEGNCDVHGRFYDWSQAKLACPAGWHLPDRKEWDVLINFAGGKDVAGKNLKAKSGWHGNGEDKFGFSAMPGISHIMECDLSCLKDSGYWWSATEKGVELAYSVDIGNGDVVYRSNLMKSGSYSVRCLQNAAKPQAAAKTGGKPQAPFTDPRDKKSYKTVKIGTQTWLAENLSFNAKGSKCYGNSEANCSKYGRLYNWQTAKAACPKGWVLPSNRDWELLINYAGGEEAAGKKLKAMIGWSNYGGKFGGGTNDYGFAALPGGFSRPKNDFYRIGSDGSWWSASPSVYNESIYSIEMSSEFYSADKYTDDKMCLRSVRCVKY